MSPNLNKPAWPWLQKRLFNNHSDDAQPHDSISKRVCNLHKKCDETYPECKRCVKSGQECYYPHLQILNNRGVTLDRPIRPAPSVTCPAWDSAAASSSATPTTRSSNSPPTFESRPTPSIPLNRFLGLSSDVPGERLQDDLLPTFAFDPNSSFDFYLPNDATWHSSLQPPVDWRQPHYEPRPVLSAADRPVILSSRSSVSNSGKPYAWPESRSTNNLTSSMTAGQASLFEALFSLGDPPLGTDTGSIVSVRSPPGSDMSSDDEDEDDPEGVRRAMCRVPGMDSNVRSNALAFVLQSYARWFAATVFEPLRIIDQAKRNIIQQFSGTDNDRTRVILIANAFSTLGKSLELRSRSLSIISVLRANAHRSFDEFESTGPEFVRQMDMQRASQALENMIEIILVHFYSSSLPVIFGLLSHAAPIFRRACPEPAGQLPNLPRILLEPGLHRRYFAAIDVSLSVVGARPMFFRYDTTYPPGFYDCEFSGDRGLEWVHGIPDRFIIMFAWVNGLKEDFEAKGIKPGDECVATVEREVRSGMDLRDVAESDPVFRVGRVAVRECWRHAVLIYLYMALCGDNAREPRVEKVFKKFMQLVQHTKSGRKPDAFLFIPMIVVGVAALSEPDRAILKQRMLGTRECSIVGIAGNNCVQVLEDLWVRMDLEGRSAAWTDFSKSYKRVVGF